MRNIILVMILLFVCGTTTAHAIVHNEGAFDEIRGDFYYTGYSLYYWSKYEKKDYLQNKNIIYKYNINKGEMQIFFEGNCFFADLKISLDKKYISSLCKELGTLYLFNMKGEKVLEISEQIQGYAWTDKENKIAFMTGTVVAKGDDISVNSTGVWLFDIGKRSKVKISEKGANLQFNTVDNFLYFSEDHKVVRYDFNNNSAQVTKHEVMNEYSPNGRYYIYIAGMEFDPPYWSPFRIFDTVLDVDLSAEQIVFVSERNPTALFWARDSKKLVFEGRSSRTDVSKVIYIYDIESKKMIKKIDGKIAGFNNDKNAFVIYSNGKFIAEKIPIYKELR